MARLTDAGVRRAREQALRATRRAQRKFDSKIEVMERRLDRGIENKSLITIGLMMSIIKDFTDLVVLIRDLERAITDSMIVFSATR